MGKKKKAQKKRDLATSDPQVDRAKGAIDGTVTSSRGRGLRGIEVSVIGADETVVATAVTGGGGTFVVENLPAGTYRLAAADPDGDFAPGWAGGASSADAGTFKLSAKQTRRTTELQLTSVADIAVTLEGQDGTTTLSINVTERGTGLAAGGRVHVVNKLIGIELPLAHGLTTMTVHAPSEMLPKKISVDYRGDEHTAPGSQLIKLR